MTVAAGASVRHWGSGLGLMASASVVVVRQGMQPWWRQRQACAAGTAAAVLGMHHWDCGHMRTSFVSVAWGREGTWPWSWWLRWACV